MKKLHKYLHKVYKDFAIFLLLSPLMEESVECAFIVGFLEGMGLSLIGVALWLKYNGEYVLIKKKKGFFK